MNIACFFEDFLVSKRGNLEAKEKPNNCFRSNPSLSE